jgi:hypothetical protein
LLAGGGEHFSRCAAPQECRDEGVGVSDDAHGRPGRPRSPRRSALQ